MMRRQPLAVILICFVLGILFQEQGGCWSLSVANQMLVVGLLGLGGLLVNTLFISRLKSFFVGFFFFTLGVFLHSLNSVRGDLPEFSGKKEIIFKIDKKLNSNQKNYRYEIEFYVDNSAYRSVLSMPKTNQEIDFQNYYKIESYINRVEAPKNDYQFNYAKYLSRRNIFYQIYISQNPEFSSRNDLSFYEKIKQKRLEIINKIDKTEINSKNRAFLKGIILADRTEMDAETLADFQRSGLIHILAISGTHIAIIFGMIFWLFSQFFSRRLTITISLIFIWLFAVFIGLGNSVFRSCLMISTYYAYVLLQRKPDMLHALSLTAFVILSIDSHQFFDVGFQLSFAAVLGIYWLNRPILKFLPKPRNNFQKFLVNIPSVTLSAQIGALPFVLYYFHQFSLISVVANLIIIPFVEIIIIFSFLMVIFIATDFDFSWLISIYNVLISNVLKLVKSFSEVDFLFSDTIAMSFAEVGVLVVIIYYFGLWISRKRLRIFIRLAFFVLIFCALRFGLDFYHHQKNEVVEHWIFGEKVVSVKENERVTFFVSAQSDTTKVEKYIVRPYLISCRLKNTSKRIILDNY